MIAQFFCAVPNRNELPTTTPLSFITFYLIFLKSNMIDHPGLPLTLHWSVWYDFFGIYWKVSWLRVRVSLCFFCLMLSWVTAFWVCALLPHKWFLAPTPGEGVGEKWVNRHHGHLIFFVLNFCYPSHFFIVIGLTILKSSWSMVTQKLYIFFTITVFICIVLIISFLKN